MQEKERCFACGADGSVEELYEFDGRHYCYRCLNERTVICEHCGTRIYTLKYNTFVASLQFVDRLCDLALFMSDEELPICPNNNMPPVR